MLKIADTTTCGVKTDMPFIARKIYQYAILLKSRHVIANHLFGLWCSLMDDPADLLQLWPDMLWKSKDIGVCRLVLGRCCFHVVKAYAARY